MTRGQMFYCIALLLAATAAACGYYRIVPKAIDPDKLTIHESAQKSAAPEPAKTIDGVPELSQTNDVAPETGPGSVATPRRVLPATLINTPAKAHLRDGSVVLFPNGFRVEGGLFKGDGEKYDLTRQTRSLVWEVPLSDVVLLEHYDADLRPVLSTVASISSGFVYLLGVDLLVLLLGTL